MNKLNLSLLTTALIACGYASSAAASSQATLEAKKADKVESITDTYYEDSEGFAFGVSSAEKGWGWGSKLTAENDLMAAVNYCTSDCTTSTATGGSSVIDGGGNDGGGNDGGGDTATSASTVTETTVYTMVEVDEVVDQPSPFHTTVESHIAWEIVRDFNTDVIYKA